MSVLGTLIITGTTAFATTGKVNTNGVRVRKDASTDSEILTNLNNGATVDVIETSGDWYKVKYENQEGYMYKKFITVTEEIKNASTTISTASGETEKNTETPADNIIEGKPEEKPQEATSNEQTITTGINTEFPKEINIINETKLFLLPSISSKVKTVISAQSKITITKELNNWQYVITNDNISG